MKLLNLSAKLPEFMKDEEHRGKELITPDMTVWMVKGADGELEFRLPETGYEQHSPLDLLLLAIIDAHPLAGTRRLADGNVHERLRNAKRYLLGSKRYRRPSASKDGEILLNVAWRAYRAQFDGKPIDDIELAPIIYECAPNRVFTGNLISNVRRKGKTELFARSPGSSKPTGTIISPAPPPIWTKIVAKFLQ